MRRPFERYIRPTHLTVWMLKLDESVSPLPGKKMLFISIVMKGWAVGFHCLPNPNGYKFAQESPER